MPGPYGSPRHRRPGIDSRSLEGGVGWVVRSLLPAAGLLGMQGCRCPVGVTVASGLRPRTPALEAQQVRSPSGERGVLEGNHWPAWIPRTPQSIPAGTLFKTQNLPAGLPGIQQPWNQKSVEKGQRRAWLEGGRLGVSSTTRGRGWVDNPRQGSPLVQSPPYLCATPEKGHEKLSL